MIERELIAACLAKPDLLHEIDLEPQHFGSEVCQTIWGKMLELSKAGEPFDAVTVSGELGRLGAEVISIVNDRVGSSTNAHSYAKKIRQAWVDTESQRIMASGEPLDEIITQLMNLNTSNTAQSITIQEAMQQALDDMVAASECQGIRGITTGLERLDSHLGGWHNGDLAVVGARPAMGKTALLLHFASKCGVPLGLISTEQPAYQIAQRHCASIGKVSLRDLRSGKVGDAEMKAVIAVNRMLKDYHIYDQSSPTILDIMRQARKWKHRHGIRILFVDYIQRIKGAGDRRHEQVGDVVRGLKTLARDLNIPVVALAQVSRAVESRQDRRPNMGDLSDSSEIEKEADQVLTLYRDEVYDENTLDKGIAEIDICKNRHGHTGFVKVAWHGATVSFGDLSWYD